MCPEIGEILGEIYPMSTRKDPITGDQLTLGEYASWIVQGIIRRWSILILLTILTAVVWSSRNPTALSWWNLGASYYAILIETVVGIAMFGQTRRDAVVLREIRAIGQRIEQIEQREAQDIESIEELLTTAE
jgi:hypothetical protein